MRSHPRSPCPPPPRNGCRRLFGVALVCLLSAAVRAEPNESEWVKTRFRVTLSAEAPTTWRGELSLSAGRLENHRPLSIDPVAVAAVRPTGGRVVLDHREPRAAEAFDITAHGPPDADFVCRLVDAEGKPVASASIPVAIARESPRRAELGDATRWFQLNRPDGDRLRIDTTRESLLFEPNESFSFDVLAEPPGLEAGDVYDLNATLSRGRTGQEVWRNEPIRVDVREGAARESLTIPLPAEEGVYRITLAATRPAGFRARFLPNATSAPLATRTFQVAVFDAGRRPDSPGDWRETYAFEPGTQRWADRLPDWMRWRRLPWFAKGPLSSEANGPRGGAAAISPMADSGAAHWRAYPLPIDQPGALYAIEVEPTGDPDRALTLALLEPDAAGVLRVVGRAVTDYGRRWHTDADRPAIRMAARPRTSSPLLVIANPSKQDAVSFGKIRLLKSAGVEPSAPSNERVVALDWPDADLPRSVGASLARSPGGGLETPDLQSHWETARRLAERVEAAGANAAVVPVNQRGSAIYDSRLWRGPQLDLGVWADAMGDLPRRELLRLVMAEFGRRELRIVPAIRFDAPTAPSEATAAADDEPSRQRIAVVRDLLATLGEHEAIAAIAVRLSEEDWALLGDPEEDQNAWRAHLAASGAADEAQPDPAAFDAWRSQRLADSYNDLARVAGLGGARQDAGLPLVVLPGELARRGGLAEAVAPRLGASNSATAQELNRLGLGFAPGAAEAFAIATPFGLTTPHGSGGLASRPSALESLRRAMPLPSRPMACSLRGSGLSLRLRDSARRLTRDGTPLGNDLVLRTVAIDRPSEAALLAEATAEGAPIVVLDGAAPAGVLDERLAEQRRQLAALPAPSTETPDSATEGRGDVSATAYDAADGGSIVVVANRSAWPRAVRATIETPARTLGARIEAEPGRGEWFLAGDHAVAIELGPHESAAWRFRAPGVRVSGVRLEPNNEALAELAEAVASLRARDTTLRRRLETLPNPSFEATANDDPLEGWEQLQGDVGVERDAHDGDAAARLRATPRVPASLSSQPFPAPETGQLVLGLWVRGGELSPDTELRLVVESLDGAYRNGTRLPAAQLQRSSPEEQDADAESEEPDNGDTWREVVFPMDDLPLDSPSPLRLSLTLVGRGDVAVDGVWAEDLILPLDGYGSIDLRSEKFALVGLFSAADGTLEEGRLEACRSLLDSYWARFLVEHFPLRADPAEDVAQNDLDGANETAGEGAEGEADPPSVGERLRGYLWRSWW